MKLLVRGEGLPNKNPVILDRRKNRVKPLVVIDQREDAIFFDHPNGDMMMGGAILDEAGNPMIGLPQGMGFADLNGNFPQARRAYQTLLSRLQVSRYFGRELLGMSDCP